MLNRSFTHKMLVYPVMFAFAGLLAPNTEEDTATAATMGQPASNIALIEPTLF
jgi:hypothetical protein